MIEKIVSGGQTGADRAALDVGRALGLETGGWVPRGRRAEDGTIPASYAGLTECDSRDYAERTRRNVEDADATLVLCLGPPRGGTALTVDHARACRKPLLVLDLDVCSEERAAASIRAWLAEVEPRVLNVAGPRQSKAPRIGQATVRILEAALAGDDS